MASSGSKLCVFIAVWMFAGVAHSFVKLKCDESSIGLLGHQSLLKCAIIPGPDDGDVKVRAVTWKKTGNKDSLLYFYRGENKLQQGYQFAESSWDVNNMNVSLLITHTKVEDAGTYKCEVVTDSGDDTNPTSLTVKARYSAPSISRVAETETPNAHSALLCTSEGGYPKGSLRWFDETNGEWTASAKSEVKQMDGGLFKLTSRLPLLPKSTFSRYTCVVYNSSGSKEDEILFEMEPESKQVAGSEASTNMIYTSKVIAPVVVIGSLIVGLLLALLVYRRRAQKEARRPSTTPLMGQWSGVPRGQEDVEEGDTQEVNVIKQAP